MLIQGLCSYSGRLFPLHLLDPVSACPFIILIQADVCAMVDVMVRNFDSYTCGFESGLGHCAYGTLGKSLQFTLSSFVLSRQRLKMRVLHIDVET